MNTIQIILIISSLSMLTACGEGKISETKTNAKSKGEGKAIMMEKRYDPLGGMESVIGKENLEKTRKMQGHAGMVVNYTHCIQNVSSSGFEDWYEHLLQESKAKNPDKEIQSVTLIETCPADSVAQCDKTEAIEYYYTNSTKVLDNLKEMCNFSGTWSTNTEYTTEMKEKEKKAKATIVVEGKSYTFETDNNCLQSQGAISTPIFSNEHFEFSLSHNYPKLKNCFARYGVPTGDGATITLYKTQNNPDCNLTYDGKVIKGNAQLSDVHKPNNKVNISFDIHCL